MDLDDLMKTRNPKLRDTVHLLLVKTTEIDTASEHMAGAAGPGSLRFAPEDLGLAGDLQDVVVPDSLGAFRTGETFMHSGLSLPECMIPVLSVALGQPTTSRRTSAQLQLQYRGGKTRHITTKNPMIEVILFQQEMFATALSFRLEVRAGKKPVGQVWPPPPRWTPPPVW